MIAALLLSHALAVTPTVTPTPDAFDQGYAAGHESMLTSGAYEIIPPGAWVVTATATASPTATRRPTVNTEATCVAVGHNWTSNWTDLYDPHRHDSSGVARIWPEKAHLELSVQTTKPDHDSAWTRGAQRCRRCGLWRSTGKESSE